MTSNLHRRSLAASLAAIGGALLLVACSGESPESLLAAAKTRLASDDSKGAMIELKNSLQKDPKSAEARFLLGKTLLQTGDVAGAAIELAKAAELGYSSEALAPPLARVLLLKGKAVQLIAEYGEFKIADPKLLSELKTTLASAYAGLDKIQQAHESVEAALAADSGNAAARLLMVRLLAFEKKTDEALVALEQTLKIHPSHSEAWQLQGDLLMLDVKNDGLALQSYREALKHDKNNVSAHAGMIQLQMTRRDFDAAQKALSELQLIAPKAPQTHFFAALLALEHKDLKMADEQSQALLALRPGSAKALQLAGSIKLQRGNLAQAETHLKQALDAAPGANAARQLLARTLLQAGDAKKALETLQPLLDEKLPNAEAHATAAEAYFMLGNLNAAEQNLNQAARLNPGDYKSRTALAMVAIGKGRAEQGFDELRAISAVDPGVSADLALFNSHVIKKDYDKALAAIGKLKQKQPGQPLAANLLGRLELQRGNRLPARQAFEAAIKVDPADMPALMTLAAMDLEDKKPADAVLRFERLLEKDPANLQAQMAILNLRKQAGAGNAEQIERLNKVIKQSPVAVAPRQALIALWEGQMERKQALAAAQDAVAVIPDNAELLSALSRVQMASGDFNQALTAANQVVQLQPGQPQALVQVAELYAANKDFPAAIQALKRGLSLKEDFLPAQFMLAVLLSESGRNAEAFGIASSIQKQRPLKPAGFQLEGDLHFAARKWDAASIAYGKALDRQAGTALAIKQHQVLIAAGKKEDANKQLEQWLAKYPKDAAFMSYLGELALTQSDFLKAQQRYGEVLKLQPDNAVAANNMAWILSKEGKPEALAYAEKAVALVPKESAFLDTLAQIHSGAGRLERALEIEKQAVALSPEFPPHRLNLARLYLKIGKKAEAFEELKQLAALGDKFDQQAEVKRLQSTL